MTAGMWGPGSEEDWVDWRDLSRGWYCINLIGDILHIVGCRHFLGLDPHMQVKAKWVSPRLGDLQRLRPGARACMDCL
jgi:hypothetical protein